MDETESSGTGGGCGQARRPDDAPPTPRSPLAVRHPTPRRLPFRVVLVVLWVAALWLGLIGFLEYDRSHQREVRLSDVVYETLQLVTLESGTFEGRRPWALEIARWLLPLLAATTVLRALYIVFRDEVEWVRLRWRGEHVVICGLSRKGYLLARTCRERGRKVVVVEQDNDHKLLPECRRQGHLILVGDATRAEILRQAAVQRAERVFAVCDDDAVNVEIAVRMLRLARPDGATHAPCLIHLVNPDLCDLLTEGDLVGDAAAGGWDIQPFNVFDLGARRLLEEFDPFVRYRSTAFAPPRLVVVGLGWFGSKVVSEAGRRWSTLRRDPAALLPIAVVDRHARHVTELYAHRHPDVAGCCSLEPHEMDVLSARFHQAGFLFDDGTVAVDAVYVCLDDDSLAIQTGLVLRNHLRGTDIPIVVRVPEEASLGGLIPQLIRREGSDGQLYAFPLLNRTCTAELLDWHRR